jgi:hypothetical protein
MDSHPLFEIKEMKALMKTILFLALMWVGSWLEAAEADGYDRGPWKLVQFNPRHSFCKGGEISRNDFEIVTSRSGRGA